MIVDIEQHKVWTDISATRRHHGPWTPEEIMFFLCACMSRRILIPFTQNFLAVWGTEEIDERTGGVEGCIPWISFHSTISGEQTRFFERRNGSVIGNIEGDKYFSNVTGEPRNTGPTICGALSKTRDRSHVTGKSVRDVLRGYVPAQNFSVIVSLYDHHKYISREVVESWEASDFEYELTANRDDPNACPLFDWDFIDRQIKAYGELAYGHAVTEIDNTVLPFKQQEETNG